MLSAQQEEKRLVAVAATPGVSVLGSFGKVVNSVQGLQQRLGDFSLEEVSDAGEKTKPLIHHLSELHRKLSMFAEIKQCIANSRATIEQSRVESFDLTKLVALDQPIQVRAILHANNLVQFPRVSQTRIDSTKNSSADGLAQESPAAGVETDKADAALQPSTVSGEPETATPPRAAETEATAFPDLKVRDEEKTTEAHEQDATSESANSQSSQPEAIASLTADAIPPPQPDLDSETRLTTAQPVTAPPAIQENDGPAEEVLHPDATSNRSTSDDMKTLVRVNPEFDQRLLEDLIRNYGEFVTSPNLPATVEPLEESDNAAGHNQKPAPATASWESANKNVPNLKKQGEIDRQLKKLVKDYGEYDLYSQQSPINLKSGVVAAFLLLGVLFSGFYFLYSPKPVISSKTSSANQFGSDSTSRPPHGLANSTVTAGKVVADHNPLPLDLHQTVEASEPGAPSNQTR